MSLVFSHYGRLGDLIWSLWYVKEYCQKTNQKCIYHIQTNVKIPQPSWLDNTHMNSNVFLTREAAEFIKPLLQKCQFIDQVLIGAERPAGAINLNEYRTESLNLYGGDLRDAYYNFGEQTLPREYYKPVFDVEPSPKYKDKILFTLTQRYVNPAINYVKLKMFEDRLVFIGTEREYNVFAQKDFKVKQLATPKNLLEVAQWMKGSLGYISNQTGFFAVAEALKVPRILFPPDWMYGPDYKIIPGPKNTVPIGGKCQNISKYPIIQRVVKDVFNIQTESV